MSQRYLTAKEVGEKLQVSQATLYRLVVRGVIPQPIRFSARSRRWLEADIDNHLRKQQEQTK